MKTNPQTVSDWIRRVRENDYKVTSCEQDYSQSSQNRRQFYGAEQKRMRDFIREEKLKCTEIASVYSDKKKKHEDEASEHQYQSTLGQDSPLEE